MATPKFEFAILKRVPPWLRSKYGGPVMRALGKVFDTIAQRSIESVLVHYPRADSPTALGFIEQDRAIQRGPYEPADVYIARIKTWIDMNKIRGSSYAMAIELHAFLLHSNNVKIDIVGGNGSRVSISTAGAITIDSIAGWRAGYGYATNWSCAVIALHLPSDGWNDALLDDAGNPILTELSEFIFATVPTALIPQRTRDQLVAVARAWAPAHIADLKIAFLYPGARLWGYRTPDGYAGTWANPGSTGNLWGGGALTVRVI